VASDGLSGGSGPSVRRSPLRLGRPELGSRGAPRRGDRLAPREATSPVRIARPLHAWSGSVGVAAAFDGGCRTNQTGCTNLTTANFADLVRAAQVGRAGPPRRKWFTPESSP